MTKIILTFFLFFFFSSNSYAYVFLQCGNGLTAKRSNSNYTLRYNQVGFPTGSSYYNILESAVNKINNNPSNSYIGLVADDNDVGYNNSQSEVYFGDLQGGTGVMYPVLSYGGNQCNFTESDVVFDYNREFSLNTHENSIYSYYGDKHPLITVAIHELGHSLGLAHTTDRYSVMGTDSTFLSKNGSTAEAYLGEDASSGLVALYGLNGGNYDDFSISHWDYDSVSYSNNQAYSSHKRHPVTNVNNQELNYYTSNNERHYIVSPNQTIRIWFTYENNGTNSYNSIPIALKLSSDKTINNQDYSFGNYNVSLFRDSPDVYYIEKTFPSNLVASGSYIFSGVMIDPQNAYSETNENNNASYVGLYIN